MFLSDVGPFYTKKTLKYLEDFVDKHIFQIGFSYPIYMHTRNNLKTFNTLSLNELLTIAASKEIKPFATVLASNWQVFNASVITIFSYIEEWNTALEKHFKQSPGELKGFLSFLSRDNALGEFTSSFGETRLAELKQSCQDALAKTKNSHRIRG